MWGNYPYAAPAGTPWHRRPSIAYYKKYGAPENEELREMRRSHDQEGNERTRLARGERVHLAAMSLAEAFTASTIGRLIQSIDSLPIEAIVRNDVKRRLRDSRRGTGPKFWHFMVARRPGMPFYDNGFHDNRLPASCTSVSLALYFPSPSVTVLLATFVIDDKNGAMSRLINADYESESHDVMVRAHGKLARTRSRVPWARPKSVSLSHGRRIIELKKRKVTEDWIDEHRRVYSEWLAGRFPGVFSRYSIHHRPAVPFFLTNVATPFNNRDDGLSVLGLSHSISPWMSTYVTGWMASTDSFVTLQEYPLVFAARRGDVARKGIYLLEGSSSSLALELHSRMGAVIVQEAVRRLLENYSESLIQLRDLRGGSKVRRRPIKLAKRLNTHTLTDGIDARTIVADMEDYRRDRVADDFISIDFQIDTSLYPKEVPPEFADIRLISDQEKSLKAVAKRVDRELTASRSEITSSAQLQQIIESIRLQRLSIVLALVALTVASISLYATLTKT